MHGTHFFRRKGSKKMNHPDRNGSSCQYVTVIRNWVPQIVYPLQKSIKTINVFFLEIRLGHKARPQGKINAQSITSG
jgi:hypothetical protein